MDLSQAFITNGAGFLMLGISLLCLGFSGFALAHESATLSLPAVGRDSNPYRSVFGLFEETNGTRDLLTIPTGQDFIITAYRELGGDLEILRDDEVILGVPPSVYRVYAAGGHARLRVEGGATIRVRRYDSWSNSPYYLQGYFVASGGPHRFVSSSSASGASHVIWTSDLDRDFIVRTLLLDTSDCNFSLDGVPISHGGFPFETTGNNAVGMGRGSLVVPAGKSLSVHRTAFEGESCDYFLEGQYVEK